MNPMAGGAVCVHARYQRGYYPPHLSPKAWCTARARNDQVVVDLPGWGPFEGPDSADVDDVQKQAFERSAIPVPEGVARGIVHLGDERRFDVPVPEFSPADAKRWIEVGEVPELARARHVAFVDVDSGHWPVLTASTAAAGTECAEAHLSAR